MGIKIASMNRLTPTLCLTFLLLIGCSSSKTPDEPKEIKEESSSETSISLDTPEQTLLEDGKRYFDRELYSLARENFQALKSAYPTSQYAEFAEIKIADCLFETGDYPEAAKNYEDFTKQRPAASAAPYMLFKAGRSYQLAHRGVGRDSQPLEKSREIFDQLLANYPQSNYDVQARAYRKEVVDKLAAHEQRIGRFYEKTGVEEASRARAKYFDDKWVPVIKEVDFKPPTQEAVPEGAPVTVVETTNSSVASPGKNRIAGTSSFNSPSQPKSDVAYTSARITKVECGASGADGAYIYFDRTFPSLDTFRKPTRVIPTDGSVSIRLNGVRSPSQTSSCFSKDDLTLSEDGSIVLKSTGAATVFSLASPPRLFISISK